MEEKNYGWIGLVIVVMLIAGAWWILRGSNDYGNALRWEIECTFPEEHGHIQTLTDYKLCLSKHGVKPSEGGLRRMCYYYSRDEYNALTGKYPTDAELLQDRSFKVCLHQEGLTEQGINEYNLNDYKRP